MTLDDLITRLEGAEGPDRGIDVDIMNAICPRAEDEKIFFMDKLLQSRWGRFGEPATDIGYIIEAPKLTESVDAAIALVEKVLPGRRWTVDYTESPNATIWTFEDDAWRCGEETYQIVGATPAIALVLATLQALRALSKQGDRT